MFEDVEVVVVRDRFSISVGALRVCECGAVALDVAFDVALGEGGYQSAGVHAECLS